MQADKIPKFTFLDAYVDFNNTYILMRRIKSVKALDNK